MRTKNLLKLAFTMLAMIVMTGAMAQQPWEDAGEATAGKYVRSNGTPFADPGDVNFDDKITINKSMPFWVWPSVAYNPDFVTTGFDVNYPTVAQITANVISNFTWAPGVDGTAANQDQNYVEISWSTTGQKTINVFETPLSALCPGDPVYFGLTVIDEPSATVVGAGTALGLNNVIANACWDGGLNLNETAINVTLGNANEEYPYHFDVTYEVFNVAGLDGSGELPQGAAGVFDDGAAGVTDITDAAGAGPHIFGSVTGTAYPTQANPIILGAGTVLVASQDYPVQNDAITVYRITYNNVNALISRKSDYLAARAGTWSATNYANFSYYPEDGVAAAPDGTAKYIISLPTPVTGPIYHIPNNFAF